MGSGLHLRKLFVLVFAAVVACTLDGCKPDAAVQQPAIVGRGTRPPLPPEADRPPAAQGAASSDAASSTAASGIISGTIVFNGKPPAGTIDTSMDPACSLGVSGKPRLPTEQFAVKNGKLANVFLYVKSGPPEAMQPGTAFPQPVVLDQKNCQYVPHVIAVLQGGFVEFRNSDPTMHNIHTMPTDIGNETIDISEGPRGQAQQKQFIARRS